MLLKPFWKFSPIFFFFWSIECLSKLRELTLWSLFLISFSYCLLFLRILSSQSWSRFSAAFWMSLRIGSQETPLLFSSESKLSMRGYPNSGSLAVSIISLSSPWFFFVIYKRSILLFWYENWDFIFAFLKILTGLTNESAVLTWLLLSSFFDGGPVFGCSIMVK